MSDLAQRVEAALAAASAKLLAAHAQLCRAAAARLANRLPAARTIALYSRAHDLSPVDVSWIRLQVIARLGLARPLPSVVPSRAGRLERLRCAIQEWVRVQFAPHGDPVLRELLELEYTYSRAIIFRLHVRNAAWFAAAVRDEFSAPAAVALYVERMELPTCIGSAVYDQAVGQAAAVRFAGMLPPAARVGLPERAHPEMLGDAAWEGDSAVVRAPVLSTGAGALLQ